MWLSQVTAPAETPVTLSEAKAHLRVLNVSQDALITALIEAATTHLEGRHGILGRALVTQTWDTRIDRFPWQARGRLELPLPPLQTVTWIKYIDDVGAEQTLATDQYAVDPQHLIGCVRPAYGKQWPTTLCDEGAVRIRFVAGYGAASAVPRPIKQAILLLVGHWWVHREAVGDAGGPMALAVEALTSPFRMHVS